MVARRALLSVGQDVSQFIATDFQASTEKNIYLSLKDKKISLIYFPCLPEGKGMQRGGEGEKQD